MGTAEVQRKGTDVGMTSQPRLEDYVTHRECDSMHNASKTSQGVVIGLFVALIAIAVWIVSIAVQAETRSQRNEATILTVQESIHEIKQSIDKGFDEVKQELKDHNAP